MLHAGGCVATSHLITQLKSDSSAIELDFTPIINGPIDLLSETKLAFIKDEVTLPEDTGKTTIKGNDLNDMRSAYGVSQVVVRVIVLGAVLATALCIFVSNNRTKTARRMLLLTGIFSAIVALLLAVASTAQSSSSKDQVITTALIGVVLQNLSTVFIVIAVLCIGTLVGLKIYRAKFAANKTPTK